MGRRSGIILVAIALLLALAVTTDWLTDLVILPFVVALHLLQKLLYWFNVVWRL